MFSRWIARGSAWLVPASIICGVVSASCQLTPRLAADFEGRARDPIVPSQPVQRLASLPVGYSVIGTVRASCRPASATGNWRSEWLNEVDCTTELLTAVLEERAAEVGGELLVDTRCTSRRSYLDARLVGCRAQVARAEIPRIRAENEPVHVQLLALGRASEAWNILVDFTPAPGERPRAPRRSREVVEVPEVPVNHVVLGQIVTRCERGCTGPGARAGLMAAAARRGATGVALAACRPHAEGWLCVGTATAHQVDPETHPQAR